MLQNKFVILNVQETTQDQNLRQTVSNILNSIGITEEIDFELAYRRGAPRDDAEDSLCPIIIRLHRRDVVDCILKIAGKNRTERNQPRIVPHIPEQLRQQRAK